ncbi:hypothetical protein BC940DRAFT_294577 [Gongronella butleri]|nr:hypothetical protein BC940DRAFT_294577 [Gongronella butleri]
MNDKALQATFIVAFVLLRWLNRRLSKRSVMVPKHQERVVLLGCSSGIGRALALLYAQRGAHVVLVARREALLAQLEQECISAGAASVLARAVDVTDKVAVKKLFEQLAEPLDGAFDTLIYCAGAISVRPFTDLCGMDIHRVNDRNVVEVHDDQGNNDKDDDDAVDRALTRIMDINFRAAVHATRYALPLLLKSVRPNLMVVSSMAGKVGAPTRSLYSASKHALHGFFDSLRVELASKNLHVGIVCPGTVDTELRQAAVDLTSPEQVTGSKQGKLAPETVAKRIIDASDNYEREVVLPSLYAAALWLPQSWLDYFAQRKYKT